MSRRSHQANGLANQANGWRYADQGLRERCAMLIEELPEGSIQKRGIDDGSSEEDRWTAVSKLATQYIGEVVLLQPESATWTLCKVHNCQWLSEERLERQFQVNDKREPADNTSRWIGRSAKDALERQVHTTAIDQGIDQAALWPCWDNQTVRIVAPISKPDASWRAMEWRLDGEVVAIGELLVQLGGTLDFVCLARFD